MNVVIVMTYINTIKTALIVFPILAFLMTIPYMFNQYRKYGSINKLRTLIIYSFVFYMLCVYFLVILPLPKISSVHTSIFDMRMINIIPFSFIYDFLTKSPLVINDPSTYLTALKHGTFLVPFFNIMMMIPFGMYLRYYFKCDLTKVFMYAFLLSIFFELTQLSGLYFIYPGPYRFCDIDDLIQNTFGGIIGYYLFGLIQRYLPTRDVIDDTSYEKGKKVSNIRKAMAFGIDLIIVSLASIMINHFSAVSFFLIFFLYHSLFNLYNGKTIGTSFLKYYVAFDDSAFEKIIIRNLLRYLYYFGIPIIILNILRHNDLKIINYLLVLLFFLYPIMIIIMVLINKDFKYDELLATKYISVTRKNAN